MHKVRYFYHVYDEHLSSRFYYLFSVHIFIRPLHASPAEKKPPCYQGSLASVHFNSVQFGVTCLRDYITGIELARLFSNFGFC